MYRIFTLLLCGGVFGFFVPSAIVAVVSFLPFLVGILAWDLKSDYSQQLNIAADKLTTLFWQLVLFSVTASVISLSFSGFNGWLMPSVAVFGAFGVFLLLQYAFFACRGPEKPKV